MLYTDASISAAKSIDLHQSGQDHVHSASYAIIVVERNYLNNIDTATDSTTA